MEKKKIVACILAVCTAAFCAYGLFHFGNIKKTKTDVKEQIQQPQKTEQEQQLSSEKKQEVTEKKYDIQTKTKVLQNSVQKDVNIEKRTNLYNNVSSSSLPLSVIAELSDVPEFVRGNVEKLSNLSNIYMAKKYGDKLFIITDNSANIRHNIEFIEISLINGHQVKTTLGYNDTIKDSNNDIWEYDKVSKKPIRHTKYNSDGDVDFVEIWNYDEKEPIKYEMKDGQGHPISIRKETLDDSANLRVEHLVYDKNGNTKINVSATYDGADIKRFTYYNADKPNESGAVYGEYSDGIKTKETVYTSDLKVKNSYTTEYKDGNKSSITIWDSQNKEIQKLVPKEANSL